MVVTILYGYAPFVRLTWATYKDWKNILNEASEGVYESHKVLKPQHLYYY